MLKQLLHKLASTTLAILLLLSTVSFTVEKHFCGDVLIDVAVFSATEKCGMDASDGEHQEDMVTTSCCKDILDIIEGQNELTVKTIDDLELEQQLFLASYIYTYNNLFEYLPKQAIPHRNYTPPNLIADIQMLDQVFLI